MYGIASSTSSVKDIRLEQDALEELIKYTNTWQSYVAAGYDPPGGTQPPFGEIIKLGDNNIVEGRLYHNITEQYTGQYSKYYNIKTWIEWDHSYLTGTKNNKLEFEVNQIVF